MEQYNALKVVELKQILKSRSIESKNLKLKKDIIQALINHDESTSQKENIENISEKVTEISIDEEFDTLLANKNELMNFDFDSFEKVENEPITLEDDYDMHEEETTSFDDSQSRGSYNNITEKEEVENGVVIEPEVLISNVETENTIVHSNSNQSHSIGLNKKKICEAPTLFSYEDQIRKNSNSSISKKRDLSVISNMYSTLKHILLYFVVLSIIVPAWFNAFSD